MQALDFDDFAGRLSRVDKKGIIAGQYRYNTQGQMIRRHTPENSRTIHVLHDLDDHRIAEYDALSGMVLAEYIWLNGEPIAALVAGQMHYLRTDHIGRPALATDASGAVTSQVSYTTFGAVHSVTGLDTGLRFPGQVYHWESALHQNWMRDYDPSTGRYIQADPLGLVDGASVYGYALQSPGRYVDPRGEESGPKGTSKVPGTGYHVRIDKPTQPNQKRHAHIYDRKMCEKCVVNDDGSPSHKSDTSKIKRVLKNSKLKNYLSARGFNLSNPAISLLEFCLPSALQMKREMECRVNPINCVLDLNT